MLRFWPSSDKAVDGQEELEDHIEELEEIRAKRLGDESFGAPPNTPLGFDRAEEAETGIRRQLRLQRAEQSESISLWA